VPPRIISEMVNIAQGSRNHESTQDGGLKYLIQGLPSCRLQLMVDENAEENAGKVQQIGPCERCPGKDKKQAYGN
jgi:hypothetical protein